MPKKTKEKSTVIVIHPNGKYDSFETDKLSLERAQELVEGYVQVVPLFNKFKGSSCVVLCDEEGKLKGYDVNNRATLEWYKAAGGYHDDQLVGKIVVVMGPEARKWG